MKFRPFPYSLTVFDDGVKNLSFLLLFFQEQLSRFVPRLVQLLAEWTDKFPYDFRDERVMAHVREITHQCVSVEPAVRHQVSAMLQTLLHRLTALDKYETFLQQTGTDATVSSADALSPVSHSRRTRF